ncbi:Uma2 family endonuclease [Spirosoma sp. SC4-14]|uniref:Uma2 family endonuclease n=1 Tax=Spirosoma sp. SC4-14 TaxID=3128900 RepID=UPI0030D5545A
MMKRCNIRHQLWLSRFCRKEQLNANEATPVEDIKFDDYAALGIRKYWLVDPARQTVEQFRLDEEFTEQLVHISSSAAESGLCTLPKRSISFSTINRLFHVT